MEAQTWPGNCPHRTLDVPFAHPINVGASVRNQASPIPASFTLRPSPAACLAPLSFALLPFLVEYLYLSWTSLISLILGRSKDT